MSSAKRGEEAPQKGDPRGRGTLCEEDPGEGKPVGRDPCGKGTQGRGTPWERISVGRGPRGGGPHGKGSLWEGHPGEGTPCPGTLSASGTLGFLLLGGAALLQTHEA